MGTCMYENVKSVVSKGLSLLFDVLFSSISGFSSCTVGIAFPVYSTFKAIEKKDQSEQERWLLYWAG